MANALSFGNTYIAQVQALVKALQTLNDMDYELTQQPAIFTQWQTANAAAGGRQDIGANDLQNAANAIAQLQFAFTSGSPTTASYLLNLL